MLNTKLVDVETCAKSSKHTLFPNEIPYNKSLITFTQLLFCEKEMLLFLLSLPRRIKFFPKFFLFFGFNLPGKCNKNAIKLAARQQAIKKKLKRETSTSAN